jgi:hypothetical protein
MSRMQSCTRSKTVLAWPGNLSIGSILLAASLVILIPSTRVNAAALRASPCTLAWNTCTNSVVSGYAIYYGVTGSITTNRLDAGLTNRVTFQNLYARTNYFFHAVAYNASGIESPRSPVMHYAPPAMTSFKVAMATNGAMRVSVRVGTNGVCRIEYSNGIQPLEWHPLLSTVADANGNVVFTDPLTDRPPSRYYRVVLP